MLPSPGDEPYLPAGTMPPGFAVPPPGMPHSFLGPETPDSYGFPKDGTTGTNDSPPGLHPSNPFPTGFGPAPGTPGAWQSTFSRPLTEDSRSHFPSEHQRGPLGLRNSLEASMGALSVGQPKPSNIEVTNELSIFVGDLSSTLQEEDLVNQFLDPPAWPSGHPCLVAFLQSHAHRAPHELPQANVGPAPFTGIKGAKIMTDPVTNASRGFGFVRFYNTQEAQRALVEMNGVVITPADGRSPARPLRVCPATAKSKSQSNGQQAGGVNVNGGSGKTLQGGQQPLRSSPPNVSSFTRDHHQQDGHPDRSNNRSPMAPVLIDKTSQQAANQAANAASASDPRITTVFVGGLSSLVSEATLRTFFAPFGEISYVKIPPGKGCGFVAFLRKSEAQNAIDKLQGFRLAGSSIRLSWGRSQGDKAAAAAAAAAASDFPVPAATQASQQVLQLANSFGLTGLSNNQVSQLQELIRFVHTQAANGRNVLDPKFSNTSPVVTADAIAVAQDASSAYVRSSSDGSLAMLPTLSQTGLHEGSGSYNALSSSLLLGQCRPHGTSISSMTSRNSLPRWADYESANLWGSHPESSLLGGLPRAQSPLFPLSEANPTSQL